MKPNPKILCPICHGKYYASNKSNHLKTKRHNLFLLNNEEVNKIISNNNLVN